MMIIRQSVRWLAANIHVGRGLLRTVDADVPSFYRQFPLPRKGKDPRLIDRPLPPLRLIQDGIKDNLLVSFPFPHELHGSIRGRSPQTNARAHGKTPLLVNIDLEKFYPSVTCDMVIAVWKNAFGFGPAIATLLTRLTTHCGHVPQGAPTSGYLANIVLLPAANEIRAIAAALGCTVTFYVDDISISGARAREAIEPIVAVLARHGLRIGRDKTKVMPAHSAQTITGQTINCGRPSVSRRKRDSVSELIHELKLRRRLGQDVSRLRASIEGRIAHIRFTNPGHAQRLSAQLLRVAGPRRKAVQVH